MTTVFLAPTFGVGFQAFTTGGLPLTLGRIYTYLAGSTTPAATYTTIAGNVQNANYIELGADGRPPFEIWLEEGIAYRFDLKTSADVLIKTYDNLYGINDVTEPIVYPSAILKGSGGNLASAVAGVDYAGLASNNTYTKANRGAYVALTSTSNSVAVNLALSNNYSHTLTESTTLAAPTNIVAGQSGAIEVTQHASSAKTLAYNAFWKWAGGTPGTVSATLSSKNVICYLVDAGGTFATCTMNAAIA